MNVSIMPFKTEGTSRYSSSIFLYSWFLTTLVASVLILFALSLKRAMISAFDISPEGASVGSVAAGAVVSSVLSAPEVGACVVG